VFFARTTLKDLGLRVQLGHPVGQRCVNPRRAYNDEFVVLDTLGIHDVGLDYCGCETAKPEPIQLLRFRWFPATSESPKTAATFTMLEFFHLLTFESKASAFEYYHTLHRLTVNTGLRSPKVSYSSQLSRVCLTRFFL
jgi:hypothetical protein